MENINTIKADIIAQIDKRLENKIIEPANAKLLKKLVLNAETSNEAMMIAELGTTYKRTGFHFDKRLEKLGSDIKYLKKNNALSFDSGHNTLTHKLIVGDNYDALQQLLITHKGMIDVIYIEPPYKKDSMGDFAKINYENAISRDNLLSMLYPRLMLARQLLKNEGIIFCSIDNKNHAYVKCLMDEVFDEKNCISDICVVNNLSGRPDDKFFATATEYVLAYAKQISCTTIYGFDMTDEASADYKYTDSISRYKEENLRMSGKNCYKEDRPNLYYPIYYSPSNNSLSLENEYPDSIEILPVINGRDGRWRWGKDTFLEKHKTELVCKKTGDGYSVYVKIRDIVGGEPRTIKPKTIWQSPKYDTGNATRQIKEILNDKIFDFPKPCDFIKDLIFVATRKNKNAIILDFFAGSGTTGQAVLALNREDGGNRQFILCTNNEKTNINPNGIVYDVTSKRLKRVMTGECYDGSANFKWLEKNKPYGDNLEILDIVSINAAEQTEGESPFDVIDETCYGLPLFESAQEKIAWVCNNFENTQNYIKEEKEQYASRSN